MCAMHKGLHRAYGTSHHDVRATIKAVYSLSYHLPTPPLLWQASWSPGYASMPTGTGTRMHHGGYRETMQCRVSLVIADGLLVGVIPSSSQCRFSPLFGLMPS